MVLKNVTQSKLICKDLKLVSSLWDKLLGLILPQNPRFLLFKTRFGIHTFFLKSPIDIIILDKKYKVVKLKESLVPNQIFLWNPKYNLVMESPKGTIKKFKLKVKDFLKIT